MERSFRGILELEINESGTKATLNFSPSEDGAEWNREKIIKLFEERGIKESIDPSLVEAAIAKFSSMKSGSESVTVAHGVEPEAGEEGSILWEELTVPEEMAETASRILERAPSPEVYEVYEAKKKVEQKEKKKSFLPFLPAKEKTSVKWVKEEVKRKVGIEERIEGYGFVEEGDLLARIREGKPGREGKSIFGKRIEPPGQKKVSVYLGNGVKREGQEIKAEITGLARRGKNWIDIIEFQPHSIEVKASKDRATCLLDFTPGKGNTELPDIESIIKRCRDLGFKEEELISPEEIREVLRNSINQSKRLSDYPLSGTEDSKILISVSADKLKAYLTLKKGSGKGKPLSLKEVGERIKSYKFKGMDTERVKKDILDFYHSEKKELIGYLLVEGEAPEKGEDGEVKCEFNYLSEEDAKRIKALTEERRERLSDIKSFDEFPITAVEKIGLIKEGDRIASIVQPTAGKPGKDVFGNTIPGKKGKEAAFKVFENLKVSASEIVSATDGIIEAGNVEGYLCFRARPHRNGDAEVVISEDRMKAYLTVYPPLGAGEPVTVQAIEKAIDEAGVKKGIKEEVLKKAIEIAEEGRGVDKLLFAEGKLPRHDEAKKPVFHVQFATGKRVRIREDGKADYKNTDLITVVEKDQLLAEVDATEIEKEDGWDVTGSVLPAAKSVQTLLTAGKNVRTEEEGKLVKYYAEKDGELKYERNTLEVIEVHSVEGNAGLETGNIKFSGSVVIKGSVLDGIKVIAGGDVVVGENVQAALVSADGEIVVKGGVKGANKGILRAKKGIEASFLEQALVLSVGDVNVHGSCLRCTVKCNSKLLLDSDKGNLIGGSVKARKGIEVQNLGSESWAKTQVSFGQDYIVEDQIQLETRELEKLKKKIAMLDTAVRKLERSGSKEKIDVLRKEKVVALKMLERRSHRIFALKEKFEEHTPSEVVVRGNLYPGVKIESHGRFYEPDKVEKDVILFFNRERGIIEKKKRGEKND